MNDKETELYRIVDSVVSCCATQIDAEGHVSLTAADVLGKSRAENVLMARCILVGEISGAGYSVTTAAQLLGRTPAGHTALAGTRLSVPQNLKSL